MTITGTPIADALAAEQAPTYDLGAERTLLGILMADPAKVGEVLDLDPELFYKSQHGEVFAAILKLHAEGKPTEPQSVTAYLADEGSISRLGGAEYLAECYESVPVTAMLGHYVDRLVVTGERRNYQAAGIRITDAATRPGQDPAGLAALAQELIAKARIGRRELELHQLGALINPCLDDIEVRQHKPKGIKCGFIDLDRVIGGMSPKQLITVAGPTGSGKSVFVTDIARHVAIRGRLTVAFFSLEMSKEEIFDRVIAAEAGVPHMAVRDGTLSERDWSKVTAKIGPMSHAPLFMADDGTLTVAQIKHRCKRLRDARGLDLIVVDHMHLLAPSARCRDERERIEDVSRGLKELAMGMDIPVMAAAHMNRNPALRADKKPQLPDLKGASGIEQNSNVVLMLHREDYYDPSSPRRGELDVVVAKNRSGEMRSVVLAAQLDKSRFVDMAVV
jgi:replicative DNA helicase